MVDTRKSEKAQDFAIQPSARGRTPLGRIFAVTLVVALVISMEIGADFAVNHLSIGLEPAFIGVLTQLGWPNGFEGLTAVDFTPMALAMLQHNAVQYGAVMLLAILAALLAGDFSRRNFGFTLGERSLFQNIRIGIAAGVLTSLLGSLIFVGKEVFELGGDTPFWWAMERTQWDWDFWLVTFIGSFGFVALVEELAFRSGMLGRLAQSFRPGAALLGIGVIFTYMHDQYFALGAIGWITLASVLISAVIFGYVFLRTGSILPAVIAHAMINFPLSFEGNIIRGIVCIIILVLIWRPVWEAVMRIGRSLISWDTPLVTSLFGFFGLVFWLTTTQLGISENLAEYAIVGIALTLAFLNRLTKSRTA